MKRSIFLGWVGTVALLVTAGAAPAQVTCPGDCNGDEGTMVNEVVTCVNTALGGALTCEACDVNGDGMVAINELVAAVNSVLCGCAGCSGNPTPTPTQGTGPFCGDGAMNVEGETCDDGNNFGGDGCAANCTAEDRRDGVFDAQKTVATVQTEAIPIVINLTGSQTFITGKVRDTAVMGPGNQTLFTPGEMPVVIKATDLHFDPVKVTGLVCACVRGVPVESFGPGISATGSIGCGENGLTDISYRLIQDHNTNPGAAANRTQGSPDDPECNDQTELPGGTTSSACVEGTDKAGCTDYGNTKLHPHIGVCNGPRVLTRSGGMAPRGSAFILNNTAIGLLQDAGRCSTAGPRPDGSCPYPDYGADCLPCTDDDTEKGNAENIPTTTGSAEAAVYDSNNSASSPTDPIIIDKDQSCFGLPCTTSVTGAVFDCDVLTSSTSGGLSGGSIVVAFPSLDANQIGDNVTTTAFFNQ